MALAHSWFTLQRGVGEVVDGPLSASAARAGIGIDKLQKDITQQREMKRFEALDVQLRALPDEEDMRRTAWLNLDCNSTVWMTAWPTKETYLSNPEFEEVSSFYFGMPSPACMPHVCASLGRTGLTVDAYGLRLTTAQLPGDGWRNQHDSLKWRIQQDAKEMGIRIRTEVYGLFAACMPQQGRTRAAALPVRKRQGLVPDFMITVPLDGPERQLLFELKTLHVGTSTYTGTDRRC